jgi:regulator of protease activity HflC (stomatin/prohibitin superfamily)
VPAKHVGILFVDGELKNTLSPGQYGFWQLNNKVEVKAFDLRSTIHEVSGQEILTKDKVSVRVNLTATVKLLDAVVAAEQVDDVNEFIYKSMQLALREAVGTKTLDALLEDKLYINQTVKGLVEQELLSVGVKLERVGVKDIILPGEIKTILNQVVEAQKAAEANVIKRREETAATRSLHNTAKMMENNPTLLRLKELEALEKVSEKVGHLNVYGGIDQLMRETVKLT